jgi:uncharacterized protein YbbC (DUF1343 family)
MKLGVDCLLEDAAMLKQLKGCRIALLAHPASMTEKFVHTLDALCEIPGLDVTAAFGPQHGLRGDKQDNMIETEDEFDPVHNIPAFSLYGRVRRPTPVMMETFDVLLVDVQDVGCRIYTFLTTLFYLLEDCTRWGKKLWVLDRPNPAGRAVEGPLLAPDYESFVGAARLPLRHGLTLGEAAAWYVNDRGLDVNLNVISLSGYDPLQQPGYGWPSDQLPWVNPSPNIANLNAARAYAGTVLLEGTTLSEGRGTTRPLEMVGAPDLDIDSLLAMMQKLAPRWLRGCKIRRCFFEPTFHKHVGKRCAGFQVHTDHPDYDPQAFKPYRLIALFLKALRMRYPDYEIWRDFEYEYVTNRLAIDVINGSDFLRKWVDEAEATITDMEQKLIKDENFWLQKCTAFHIY